MREIPCTRLRTGSTGSTARAPRAPRIPLAISGKASLGITTLRPGCSTRAIKPTTRRRGSDRTTSAASSGTAGGRTRGPRAPGGPCTIYGHRARLGVTIFRSSRSAIARGSSVGSSGLNSTRGFTGTWQELTLAQSLFTYQYRRP